MDLRHRENIQKNVMHAIEKKQNQTLKISISINVTEHVLECEVEFEKGK